MPLKKVFLSCLIFTAISSQAQFKKGTKMVGAGIASSFISTGKTDYSFPNGTEGYTANQNNFSLNVNPSVGWFINKNCVVGGQIIFSMSNQKTWLESASNGNTYQKDNYKNTDFGAGAFFRYYLSSPTKIKPFAHLYFNGGSGSTTTNGFYYATDFSQTYEGESSSRFFYNLGLNAGITKMINQSIGLEGFVGYAHSYNKFTTTTRANTNDNGTVTSSEYQPTQKFNGNGVNIGIGLQVFL
jgi:hypothetical protein